MRCEPDYRLIFHPIRSNAAKTRLAFVLAHLLMQQRAYSNPGCFHHFQVGRQVL